MLAAQIFRLGSEKAGFDFVKKLDPSVAQYTKGANGSIPLVAQGEAYIGFAWGHDALKQKMQGNLPITVVFPKDTGYEIGCASILKNAPHLDAAKKFIDFMLSPKAEQINANNGFRYPVRGGCRDARRRAAVREPQTGSMGPQGSGGQCRSLEERVGEYYRQISA